MFLALIRSINSSIYGIVTYRMERKALRKPIQRVVMVIRDGGNIAIKDAVKDKLKFKISSR